MYGAFKWHFREKEQHRMRELLHIENTLTVKSSIKQKIRKLNLTY